MESNKLIAEFMGYTHQSDSEFKDENGFWNDFEVFETWNWLMPVIEEIDHLQFEPIESIEKALFTRSIRDTHKAVVEFIKQYNGGHNKM